MLGGLACLIMENRRSDYGEGRFTAFEMVDNRIVRLAFIWRSDRYRVISIKKANARETRGELRQTRRAVLRCAADEQKHLRYAAAISSRRANAKIARCLAQERQRRSTLSAFAGL